MVGWVTFSRLELLWVTDSPCYQQIDWHHSLTQPTCWIMAREMGKSERHIEGKREIGVCSNCGKRVIPEVEGTCPACHSVFVEAMDQATARKAYVGSEILLSGRRSVFAFLKITATVIGGIVAFVLLCRLVVYSPSIGLAGILVMMILAGILGKYSAKRADRRWEKVLIVLSLVAVFALLLAMFLIACVLRVANLSSW